VQLATNTPKLNNPAFLLSFQYYAGFFVPIIVCTNANTYAIDLSMSKRLIKTRIDRAAKKIPSRDLTNYLSPDTFKRTTFEFAPKDKSITLRISSELLQAVQDVAKMRRTNYQKLIREAIEQYLKKAA